MSIAKTFLLAGIMVGIPIGMLTTWLFYLLPMNRKQRRDAHATAEARNILRQFSPAEPPMVSAFDHGMDGYLPKHGRGPRSPLPDYNAPQPGFRAVYPGNTGRLDEPDQQWLNWLAERPGADYFGPRGLRRADPHPVRVVEVEPELPWIRWRAGDKALARWRAGDKALALLVAPVVRPPRSGYPWWQKVADRVWEFMMVAEHHAVRWHRAQQRWLEQVMEAVVWGTAEWAARLAGAVAAGFGELIYVLQQTLVGSSMRLLRMWHGSPSVRPKRQYRLEQAQ